jgi:hypothetical protein
MSPDGQFYPSCEMELSDGARAASSRSRRIAFGLAAALIVLATLAVGLAAVADFTLSPQQSLDPHRSGFGIAAGFAVAFCLVALWRLREVGRGRSGWLGTSVWFGLAVLALFVLIGVGVWSRLGG